MSATLLINQLREGSRIAYDDGRGEAKATVISVNHVGMHVQFDDRASSNYVRFIDRAWMDYITLEND